jgi:hypothetical protein
MPAHRAPAGIDSVHASAARRDVHGSARVGRGRDDLVVSQERPLEEGAPSPTQRVRIEMVIPGAEEEPIPDQQGRRLDRSGVHAPELVTRPRVPRDHETSRATRALLAWKPIHERLVDDAVADRGRRSGAVREVPRPHHLPRASVEREEAALLLRDVDLAVRDRGRKLDVGARLQLPEAVVRRAKPLPPRGEVRALHVVAVRRPLLLEEPARLCLLLALFRLRPRRVGAERLRELLGRGAANVTRALLVPGPGPERGPEAESEQAHRQERPAQDPDPAAQERVGDDEHDPGREKDFRCVGDRAFERCGERQDAGQVSEGCCRPRRLPWRDGRWRSP